MPGSDMQAALAAHLAGQGPDGAPGVPGGAAGGPPPGAAPGGAGDDQRSQILSLIIDAINQGIIGPQDLEMLLQMGHDEPEAGPGGPPGGAPGGMPPGMPPR